MYIQEAVEFGYDEILRHLENNGWYVNVKEVSQLKWEVAVISRNNSIVITEEGQSKYGTIGKVLSKLNEELFY